MNNSEIKNAPPLFFYNIIDADTIGANIVAQFNRKKEWCFHAILFSDFLIGNLKKWKTEFVGNVLKTPKTVFIVFDLALLKYVEGNKEDLMEINFCEEVFKTSFQFLWELVFTKSPTLYIREN